MEEGALVVTAEEAAQYRGTSELVRLIARRKLIADDRFSSTNKHNGEIRKREKNFFNLSATLRLEMLYM